MNKNTPQATSSLDEWLYYLENQHNKAIDMGLARISKVAHELELTKPAPYTITVAGTNGKGTTCKILELALINAGYKVGVYSSPHLYHYNERVRIQGKVLEDHYHVSSFDKIEKNRSESLTYFEFSTLSAFYLFKQQQVDIAILEVGLGGRLDATNIIDHDMSIITSIGIDHVEFLGNDRESIGYEKAGILRSNKPAIIGEPEIPKSILDYGQKINAQLILNGQDWSYAQIDGDDEHWIWSDHNIEIKLPIPNIPLNNAATAFTAMRALPFKVPLFAIEEALRTVKLIGRFQYLTKEEVTKLCQNLAPNDESLPTIILDVGHNAHAANYLAKQLQQYKAKHKGNILIVLGMLIDKDAAKVAEALRNVCDKWFIVGLNGYRGQDANLLYTKISTEIKDQPSQCFTDVREGVTHALFETSEHDTIVVMGSFHTVADCLAIIDK